MDAYFAIQEQVWTARSDIYPPCIQSYYTYILLDVREYFPYPGLKFVLIKNTDLEKFNVYETLVLIEPYILAKYYEPLTLEVAKSLYPDMNLSNDNYGFPKPN